MNAKLVHTESGRELTTGSMLHPVTGGACWRYDGVAQHPTADHGGSVHVSRHTPVGRAHRQFAPHAFGCTLVVDVKLYADRERWERCMRSLVVSTGGMVVGGIIAWIIAVFASHMMGV